MQAVPGHRLEKLKGQRSGRYMDMTLSRIHPGEVLLEDFMKPL